MRLRAVIFDLWETLIDWDADAAAAMVARVSELSGDGFVERWNKSQTRYVGPIRPALGEAGVPVAVLEEVCAMRLDYIRRSVVPRPGAVETLRELRRRGLLVGLITVCTEDVERVWPESEFAGLFDAEVFSSQVGLSKPDPRIYLLCAELLGVEPRRGRVRRRRRERRAGRSAEGGHACAADPPARRPTVVAGGTGVGWSPRHIDSRGSGGARRMMIATTNELPGYVIDEVYGEVFGLTVRSRNIGSQIGAGLKSIFGGELKGMTKALVDSRNQVIERMVAEAEAKGANAVVAMRFDTSELGKTWTEICAYGTAVRAHKA